MSLTAEEKVAARLGGEKVIAAMIEGRQALINQMTGTLYPSILRADIADLEEIADEVRLHGSH